MHTQTRPPAADTTVPRQRYTHLLPTITVDGRPAPTRLTAKVSLECAVASTREHLAAVVDAGKVLAGRIHDGHSWGAWQCQDRDELRRSVFAVRWDDPRAVTAQAAALAAIRGYATTHPTELADEQAAREAAERAEADRRWLQSHITLLRRLRRRRVNDALDAFDPADAEAVTWMRERGHDPATYRSEVVRRVLSLYGRRIAAARRQLHALGGAR
ncbi:hypothetical protein [Thalassiella azotivora]